MSNSVVRVELETRLNTWAKSQSPPIPVAFENVAFSKPSTGMFLEAFLIPSSTMDVTVDGTRQRYIGLFQINCWTKTGVGMGKVEKLAKDIADLYPLLPKTGVVSVDETPCIEEPIPDVSGWVIVPVTVKYRYESES